MKVITTPLKDLLLVEFTPLENEGLESVEVFSKQPLAEMGLHCGCERLVAHHFPSACISPLYYTQTEKARLLTVSEGQGWLVAVDLRVNSSTFSRYYGVELSYHAGLSVLLPAGFAFGIANSDAAPLTLFELADKQTRTYLFNPLDGGLAIRWPVNLSLCPVKSALLQVQDGIRNQLFMEV